MLRLTMVAAIRLRVQAVPLGGQPRSASLGQRKPAPGNSQEAVKDTWLLTVSLAGEEEGEGKLRPVDSCCYMPRSFR